MPENDLKIYAEQRKDGLMVIGYQPLDNWIVADGRADAVKTLRSKQRRIASSEAI